MRSYLALTGLLLTTLSATCAAETFKCVGADGKVAFSDQRCETDRPPAKAPAAAPEAPRGPTPEQQRLKVLEAVSIDHSANAEQKTAAMLEAGNIRRGLESKMTPAERERRDALTKELASPDAEKRAAALRDLRSIYRD